MPSLDLNVTSKMLIESIENVPQLSNILSTFLSAGLKEWAVFCPNSPYFPLAPAIM